MAYTYIPGATNVPFLDASSGNFRISFYIITGARDESVLEHPKAPKRFFSMNFLLSLRRGGADDVSCDSYRVRAQERGFWMKFLFFGVTFHLLLHWWHVSLHAIPISDTFSSYLHFVNFLRVTLELYFELKRELFGVAMCVCSPTTYRGRQKKKSRFSLRAMLENFSEREEKLSLLWDATKSLREMLLCDCRFSQSIRQLLHRQHQTFCLPSRDWIVPSSELKNLVTIVFFFIFEGSSRSSFLDIRVLN